MTALRATYRLQLGGGFGFAQARELVPYLRDLGVSHVYLPPSFQARAGSTPIQSRWARLTWSASGWAVSQALQIAAMTSASDAGSALRAGGAITAVLLPKTFTSHHPRLARAPARSLRRRPR